jgi:peptide/nickel transport system permease protein
LDATAGCLGDRIVYGLMRFAEFVQTVPSFAVAIVLVEILSPSIV